jgi:Ca2+-binding RTX toxin-like protein
LSAASQFNNTGNVTMEGGLGNDYINLAGLSSGSARVDAGDGDDRVAFVDAGLYTVTLDGGAGLDTLKLQAFGASHIDIGGISTVQGAVLGQAASSFQNFEVFDLLLSAADDWVKLGAGNDRVWDYGGATRIRTGAGDDSVRATVDQTVLLDGGTGSDDLTIVIGSAGYVLTVDRVTGTITDNLGSVMTNFESIGVIGTALYAARVNLGQGSEGYFAINGHDTVFGYGGDDVIVGAVLANGGGGNDELQAATLDAVLSGGSGNDLMSVRSGGFGIATLNGNDGQDRIEMNWSSVAATGGADADTFVIGPSTGLAHRITDFASGSDALHIADARVTMLTALTTADLALQSATAATAQYILRQDAALGETRLYFDSDGTGSGAESLIVTFDGLITLAASDILIF